MAILPVEISGSRIASTFWGKAWCDHLEGFSDYENRLPRGRRYVRNGSVVHLDIREGRIFALVSGSDLYEVEIAISTMPEEKWRYIQKRCTGRIGSLMALLKGRFSDDVMRVVTDPREGLFPLPGEIQLGCSCPDWAVMCKHVAATLYGVGARLDHDPSLLFRLRNVDHELLLQGEAVAAVKSAVETGGARRKLEGDVADIFGIDLEDVAETGEPAPSKKPVRAKASRKKPYAAKKKTATPDARERLPGFDAEKLYQEIDGPWLREIRERAGEISKGRLAKVLGIAPSTLTKWESRTSTLRLTDAAKRRLQSLLPSSRADELAPDRQLVADAIERWAAGRYGLAPNPRVVNGAFIRGLRESFDMEVPEFASLVGAAPGAVTTWERRKTAIPKAAYEKIAPVVGIDIGEAWDRVINS
jgi:uncharacterized Zn finger protein/transcriptional regulator with XRE-family HTH domain